MEDLHTQQTAETNDLLTICATEHCRAILSYFLDSSADTASLAELVSDIVKEDHGGTEPVSTQMHHSALPRLAETGVIDYDARGNTVRYHGHPELEALALAITDR